MQPGDTVDIEITGVAHGGLFVGRHGASDGERGRVVFTPDTLPGERVRVRLTDTSKAAFWRGETIEVLDASPHRRPHVWAEACIDRAPELRPGGADFGHTSLSQGRELKARVAREALERIGRLALDVHVDPASADDDGLGYRTRVGLHVDEEGRVGPVAARSHRVVETAGLPLAMPEIERAVASISDPRPGRIDLVLPADGRVRVIRRPDHAPGDEAVAAEIVHERVGERVFELAAGGFWQVHRDAARVLSATVAAVLADHPPAPDAEHFDLYGGVGLFAATLGDAVGADARVATVEMSAPATVAARRNLVAFPRMRAHTARVDRFLQRLEREADQARRLRIRRGTVVLDPPRAGAGRHVVASLARLGPERIVYVACDPVAFARDARMLVDSGYEIASVSGLDLFPHSHHLEVVAAFARTGS